MKITFKQLIENSNKITKHIKGFYVSHWGWLCDGESDLIFNEEDNEIVEIDDTMMLIDSNGEQIIYYISEEDLK